MGQSNSKFTHLESPPAYSSSDSLKSAEKYLKSPVSASSSISGDLLESASKSFKSLPQYQLSQSSLTHASVQSTLINREIEISSRHVFSHKLEQEGNITSQKSSGRCWLFAATNVMRLGFMKKYNLEEFELSQGFLFFVDKLEKANYFLETMIELVDEDVDSRTVQYLLQAPVNDGGQFDMIINIIEKYGVVPKAVYPDTYSCTSSGHMNWMITCKLREYSATLRCLYKAGKSKEELKSAKTEMVSEIYRILAILLGEPPKEFDFSFRDKNGKFYKFENLTPLSFYKDHVGYDVSSMVSLVHDPRHPMFSKMTVKYLKNVEEGKDVTYVNVPIHYLKGLAIEQLLKNEPVWFGCDVNKFFHNDIGVMDLKAFRYDLAFGMGFNMTKAERLQYGESQMTHAMVFTGVDLNNEGKPTRWRVENSWGVTSGEKGFESMTDAWFEEYTFQVVVPRSMLPKEVEDVLTKPAIELPPWDPMGALA